MKVEGCQDVVVYSVEGRLLAVSAVQEKLASLRCFTILSTFCSFCLLSAKRVGGHRCVGFNRNLVFVGQEPRGNLLTYHLTFSNKLHYKTKLLQARSVI